jgi:hypothetical protein
VREVTPSNEVRWSGRPTYHPVSERRARMFGRQDRCGSGITRYSSSPLSLRFGELMEWIELLKRFRPSWIDIRLRGSRSTTPER